MELTQYATTGNVEGGKQTGGAMTLVIMGAALNLPGMHRQQGRGCGRVPASGFSHPHTAPTRGRGIEVKTNDVASFIDEQWITA